MIKTSKKNTDANRGRTSEMVARRYSLKKSNYNYIDMSSHLSSKLIRPGDAAAATDGFGIAGQKVGVKRNKDPKAKKGTNAQNSPFASRLTHGTSRLKVDSHREPNVTHELNENLHQRGENGSDIPTRRTAEKASPDPDNEYAQRTISPRDMMSMEPALCGKISMNNVVGSIDILLAREAFAGVDLGERTFKDDERTGVIRTVHDD